MRMGIGVTCGVWLLCTAVYAVGAEPEKRPGAKPGEVVFSRDVAPILVQKCLGCHGERKPKGGYRVDTFEHLMRPGDSEAAPVTPGKPGESELYRLITSAVESERMPKKADALSAADAYSMRVWIEMGAPFDGEDRGAPIQSLVKVSHPAAPASYAHPVPAAALAFRPDGGAIAVGGYHEVTVWEVASGRLLRRLGNVARQTNALAYSPDGTLLAAAGGTPGALGEVRLISTADPGNVRALDRIGDVMPAVAFSPDGKRLAAGGSDGTVRVYDVASGGRTLLIEPHADWVTAVAFSPDGSRVASASRDKSARVFDASTGETLSAYLGHEEPLFALAWAANGKALYTAGREGEIHAWEPIAEPKKVREFKGFAGDVLRIAVVGDQVYSTSADGKLRQHERGNGNLATTTEVAADYLPGLAVDARHNLVATGAFDGSIHVFNAPGCARRGMFVASPGR